jgi:ubiquinone/menaquinone biosynthesis C-methylase UbiE
MASQSSRFIGSIPEHYDRGLGPRIFQDYAEDLARRVAQQGPGSVLELAAGTGIVTRALRDALPGGCQLIASDLNPPMLEQARSKFSDDEEVEFQAVDAMDLQFDDASFDALVCQFGVMFFPDKVQSYQEAHRVLKPGGHYHLNSWGSWAHNPFAHIAHKTVCGFFPDDPPGFYKVPFHYHDLDQIRADLAEAGFDEIELEQLPLESDIPSAEEFARGLVFGNPLYEEVLNRDGDPEAIRAAVATAIEDQLGSSMGLQAIVVDATKHG